MTICWENIKTIHFNFSGRSKTILRSLIALKQQNKRMTDYWFPVSHLTGLFKLASLCKVYFCGSLSCCIQPLWLSLNRGWALPLHTSSTLADKYSIGGSPEQKLSDATCANASTGHNSWLRLDPKKAKTLWHIVRVYLVLTVTACDGSVRVKFSHH